MIKVLAMGGLLLFGAAACSQNKLSDRDIQRQKDVGAAEVKKNELTKASGNYEGYLTGPNDYKQLVRLSLEVREIPVVRDGSVDPVLTPKLVGAMRFILGSEEANEYMDAVVKEAEYYPPQEKVDVVIQHEQFGDLFMSFKRDDLALAGSWRAPALGAEGQAHLPKSAGGTK